MDFVCAKSHFNWPCLFPHGSACVHQWMSLPHPLPVCVCVCVCVCVSACVCICVCTCVCTCVCICVCVCVSVFVYVCVWVCVQLRYTWDSKLMRGLMSSVTETPEIVLARENAKNFSDVSVHFAQRGHHSLWLSQWHVLSELSLYPHVTLFVLRGPTFLSLLVLYTLLVEPQQSLSLE